MAQPQRVMSSFRERVYAIVEGIPRGRVLTYGGVAYRVGVPGAARAVGTALKHNPYPKRVPCHRVVRSDGQVGEYAFGGVIAKRKKLRSERVPFRSATHVALTALEKKYSRWYAGAL